MLTVSGHECATVETHRYSGQGPGKHQIVDVPEMPNAKNFVRQLGQSCPYRHIEHFEDSRS
jgi:hypothetical protein